MNVGATQRFDRRSNAFGIFATAEMSEKRSLHDVHRKRLTDSLAEALHHRSNESFHRTTREQTHACTTTKHTQLQTQEGKESRKPRAATTEHTGFTSMLSAFTTKKRHEHNFRTNSDKATSIVDL